MVDADAVDAVGLDVAIGHGVDYGSVNCEVYFVTGDADLQIVDGFAIVAGLFDGVIVGLARDGGSGSAVAAFDEPGTVLRDDEICVGLLGAVESAAAEYQTAVVIVAARLH